SGRVRRQPQGHGDADQPGGDLTRRGPGGAESADRRRAHLCGGRADLDHADHLPAGSGQAVGSSRERGRRKQRPRHGRRTMALPLQPPLLPQLARSAPAVPDEDGWVYERKWDGFRALAFVEGDDHHLQSRNGRPLGRYFPELRFPAGRYVLDGELVIRRDGQEDFDALQERIHPAESRVRMLAERTPVMYVAFDLLAVDDRSLLELPFG